MTIKERVSYLKGLSEGLAVDKWENGNLFTGIIDALCEMADEIGKLAEATADIGEELDAISDDLADVEELLFDDEIDVDDEGYTYDFDKDEDDEDYDYEDDEPCCKGSGSSEVEFTIDISCPECSAEIKLSEEDISNESVTCKFCGELIELEIDEVDADDDDFEKENEED